MNQKQEKGKFNVPFKSPVARSSSLSVRTNYSQKPKVAGSTKENNYNKDENPTTPKRTATFSLYGVKSPYRSSKPSDRPPGKRYSFISSQVSTPGKSPSQLIKNFREKISNSSFDSTATTHDENASGKLTERADSVISTDIEASPEIATIGKPGRNHLKVNLKEKDIYDLNISPNSKSRVGKKRREEMTKQKVLLLIEKMSMEFKELKKRYQKLRRKQSSKGHSSSGLTSMVQGVGKRKNKSASVTCRIPHSSSFKQTTKKPSPRNLPVTVGDEKVKQIHIMFQSANQEPMQGDSPPFEPMEE